MKRFILPEASEEVNISDNSKQRISKNWQMIKRNNCVDPALFLKAATETQSVPYLLSYLSLYFDDLKNGYCFK